MLRNARRRMMDFWVGVFVIVTIASLVMLAFKVSTLTLFDKADGYTVSATFDNIGGLKVRAPVAISGVRIGEVTSVNLDKTSYRGIVTMHIDNKKLVIPSDSSASIYTEGLLGANYVSVMPGYSEQNLKNNGKMTTTHSALILENLIGQLLFKVGGDSSSKSDSAK